MSPKDIAGKALAFVTALQHASRDEIAEAVWSMKVTISDPKTHETLMRWDAGAVLSELFEHRVLFMRERSAYSAVPAVSEVHVDHNKQEDEGSQ